METNATVAVLGMGIIGSRCADNLIAANFDVITWNRTPGKHTTQVEELTSITEASTLCFYLTDGDACKEVFQTIKAQLKPGSSLLNHSTIDLEAALWLAEECEKIGVHYLDCPFTGSKDAATQGKLVYYVGGSEALLETHRNLLECTSKEIHHLGKLGDATIIKIATNLISASSVQAIAEAMAITSAHGISQTLFTQAVSSNACGSALSQLKMPNMEKGDYDTHFSLDNMLKDSKFALKLAKDKSIPVPSTLNVATQMQKLCDQGNGQLDFSSLFKQFEA